MKIVVLSDIHDNEERLSEVINICRDEKIKYCICCGDISKITIVNKLSTEFTKVYFALGNMDFNLKNQIGLFPENTEVSSNVLDFKIDNIDIAIVHYDYKAKELAKKRIYDYIFYGHTHTPWEKSYGKTTIINPGEISGQFGKASFATFDTVTRKAVLKLLK